MSISKILCERFMEGMSISLSENLSYGDVSDVLGTISHYNGITFGNLYAEQADCEGALAVNKNVILGSPGHGYDIGTAGVSGWESVIIGKYENENNYPTFLLGGVVVPESVSSRVYAGSVALKSSYRQEYENGTFRFDTSGLQYVEDDYVDSFFSFAKEKIDNVGYLLSMSPDENSETVMLTDLRNLSALNQTDYLSKNIDTDKNILIYTISCDEDEHLVLSDIGFGDYVLDYDAIIINAPAKKISFKGGAILYNDAIVNTSAPRIYESNELLSMLSAKIIFNFPNTEEVTFENYGLVGSIIAQNAEITGIGGSINGMLIADNLNQRDGMELHAFTIAMGENLFKLSPKNPFTNVTVQKVDNESLAGLENAEFTLFEYDINSESFILVHTDTTDENGILIFKNLRAGKYKIMETYPPQGYIIPNENELIFELKIDNQGEIIEMETIYIRNELTKYIAEFIKSDYENEHIKLGGAIFSLYKYNDKTHDYTFIEAGLESDSHGTLKLENLFFGKYRLLETDAPAGYYLPNNYTFDFEIDKDGEVKVEGGELKIYNQLLATIYLVKRDFEDSEILLHSAKFTLYKYDSETSSYKEISAGHITDSNGELSISGLYPGDYKLTETAAPSGYYLDFSDSEIIFSIEIDSDKRIIPHPTIEATNKKLGKIHVYKIDSADAEIFLEGAKFTLYKYNDEESRYDVYRTDLVTDADGCLNIENLEPGDYKLCETHSPLGYLLPENPETIFTITL